MRKSGHSVIIYSLIAVLAFAGAAEAYWVWTPETKKFVNPKYAVKDSPKEQFDWAMSFYNAKDFQRAATEFEKLAKQYEFSEYASKAQYYVGLCYENMNKYYLAFQNYQKTIDNFPHIANTDEILARQFAIGNLYLSKPSPKVLGADIMAPLDRAVEIFKKVVENAPYGKFSEESQFKLGEALKKSERYEEAMQAFHKIAEDYPNSKLIQQAMFEEADCAYKASLKPAYDVAATDNAIKTFEKFVDKNKEASLAKQADKTMKRLKDNVAEKSFKAAEFYESQGKKEAAIIYYQDVVGAYPESSFADRAKLKIDALKSGGSKKKSEPLAQEARKKKPWKSFSFAGESKPKPQEAPKGKSWNPLSFISKKPEAKKEPVIKEAPEKKPWRPFSFESKKPKKVKKEEAPVAASAEQAVEAPKQEEAMQQAKEEGPKTPEVETHGIETINQVVEAHINKPLMQEVETPKQEKSVPQIKEEPKKKVWTEKKVWKWKPLNFGTNDEPMVKEALKKKSRRQR